MLNLPIPGAVIALLLLSALTLRGRWPDVLGRMAKSLRDHFGLLFVPAGAGISAMALNAVATSILAPLLVRPLLR